MTPWWQGAAIYRIWPRSFQDSDGDGIGDLRGIAARLGHLTALGVDALWISPFHPSPLADFGCDVADHRVVDPALGSLDDFDALVAAAHARGLRVLLDYGPNHTAETHPWFAASRAARDAPQRDWYIWRDPAADGGPPNNGLSAFGGSAWTLDAGTGQYFYHASVPQQPALNWRNPAVQDAMLDVLRFWLDRGVDGFRMDGIHQLVEDAVLRDHTMDQPEVLSAVTATRRVTDAYAGQRPLIDRLMVQDGNTLSGFHLPCHVHLNTTPWTAGAVADLVRCHAAALPPGAWPNWVLGNQYLSRIGAAQARVAAMLLLTLRGTPTLCQGEELGLTDVPMPPDRVQDPREKRGPGFGRDTVRRPMPWEAGPQSGFTAGTPWLPLGEEHRARHAAAQARDPGSMLGLYRALLGLRRREAALSLGAIRAVAATGDVLRYDRTDPVDGRRLLVALNFGGAEQALDTRGRPLLSTHGDYGNPRRLRPHEGLVIEAD